MPLHSGRGLGQVADNCFIHSDGGGRPCYLVGVIHRQNTADRPPPPNCLSGFNTDGTPFAKGHVMALELGGCDQSFNIVPQYELWQGCPGAAGENTWRDMEQAIRDGISEVMVAEVNYAVVADAYAANKLAFGAGDKLLHWTGPNIPTRFRVWTVTAAMVAAYLAADAAGKVAAIDALITARHGEAALFDVTVNAMPEIDRRTWKARMVRAAANTAHATYTAAARLLRDNALLALNGPPVGGGGGPMRRPSPRLAVARHNANPLAVPLPPEPLTLVRWVGTAAGRAAVVALIQNNTGNASVNWAAHERLAFTGPSVDLAMFGA